MTDCAGDAAASERMRVYDLVLQQGPAALQQLPAWWEDIDDDPKWQEYVFVALSVVYGILAVVCLIQLCRIQIRAPVAGWTTQKVFHLLNAFVCILRCVVFALRDKVRINTLWVPWKLLVQRD